VHTAALSAFKEIHDIEAAMRTLEKRMESDHSDEVWKSMPSFSMHTSWLMVSHTPHELKRS
jgi:hypothetical protein